MVAVKMGKKNVVETRKLETLSLQLLLRSLSAIHHKQVIPEIDHRTRWIVKR